MWWHVLAGAAALLCVALAELFSEKGRRCPHCGADLSACSTYCCLCDIEWDASEVD